ncbi:MAG: GDP-mannose 4,6-dehydratase [Candidatus Magasanikbacteria bacterium RIFCSPHIGHO2_02_FULL_45_10]|uniref:GDP-mannose 4,6-dehydratase n=1 Tax=Candidatus Magasanikbacteria bacterium RIFCSPHIGHO2_02_FULL_45_10 TaxID=1798679 RepID=A0A1F6M9U9_9BACT|nr:MAG: GDP-mannose 4,6-dehydratase [Candidatus Magasanikbacteria bacterium RIFCSPHIGHO2_02_FULL_45_10]
MQNNQPRKKALITGLTGQDGSYLAEFLLAKGYEVHGIVRRSSSFNTGRIDHIYQDPHEKARKLAGDYGDLTDGSGINRLIDKVKPDEIYNLGAQSHVKVSFSMPEYTCDTVALGTLRLLDAVRDAGLNVKFYQAGSSEMFGKVLETPQKETTPFYPRSPYGCAKVFAHNLAVNYRESYNMFISNGILFNHESPRRGGTFVTKKIVSGFAKIKSGKQDKVYLGNLEARRDWGYAKEYVEAMWLMLQQPKPDDYVIATGETHSVREFAEETARHFDYELAWQGTGLEEKGVDVKTGQVLVEIDREYFRPAEVEVLIGDASKSKNKLGWEPKVNFKELIMIMCDAEKNPTPQA